MEQNNDHGYANVWYKLFNELNDYHKDYDYGGPEYLYQKHAEYYITRMPQMVPIPAFEIDVRHLSNDLRKELVNFKAVHGSPEFRNVLNKAVGRLFENINSLRYVSSIKPILWIQIVGLFTMEEREEFGSLLGDYDKTSVEAAKIIETVKSVGDPIQFILDVISKEVKKDDKLARQVLYTILGSATKNPMNLAINAPPGEGKSHVLNNVASLFSDDVVISLAGMTEKSLFHKRGMIAVKVNGQYESLRLLLHPLERRLKEIEKENAESKTKTFGDDEAKDLKDRIEELKDSAVKVIELSNKVLIFMDTPSEGLFSALMQLMSHDKEETTYDFTDTVGGIKTRTNVLRGYPSFIFTQAKDFSGYERAEEIMRRFIISNPNMDVGKYNEAADLIAKKYSVPDFYYQETECSDEEKEKARLIAGKILNDIQDLNENTKPNKNNVINPFYQTVRKSLSVSKALDMTTIGRFFGCLSLLTVIKSYKRPKLMIEYPTIVKDGESVKKPDIVIPLATFDDLQETQYLMENSSGVRPFIIEWFDRVFMSAYNDLKEPNRKDKDGKTVKESMIALSTRQLAEKHKKVYGTSPESKKLLRTYIYPLTNSGFIDSIDSELDKRSKIFYPINTEKNSNLFPNGRGNNLLQGFRLNVKDLTTYPSKEYIKSQTISVHQRRI